VLATLAAPVLVINGSEDRIAGPMDAVARALPRATTVAVPGVDHMRALANAAFRERILLFLAEAH
jgi:pimeloyl-ACP methyl ester carboxylesterase